MNGFFPPKYQYNRGNLQENTTLWHASEAFQEYIGETRDDLSMEPYILRLQYICPRFGRYQELRPIFGILFNRSSFQTEKCKEFSIDKKRSRFMALFMYTCPF